MFLIISRQIQQFSKRYHCDRLIVTYRIAAREYTSEQSTVTDLRNH